MIIVVIVLIGVICASITPPPYDEGIEEFYRTEYPHKYKNHFDDHLWRWFN